MDYLLYLSILVTPLIVLMQDADIKYKHYKEIRDLLIKKEFKRMVGGQINLSDDERNASETLTNLRMVDIHLLLNNDNGTQLTDDYFSFKEFYYPTKLFSFLRKMPKGVLLHVHEVGMLQIDLLMAFPSRVSNYMYVCFDYPAKIGWGQSKPVRECKTDWISVKDRKNNGTYKGEFEENLRKSLTIHWSEYERNQTGKYEQLNHYFDVVRTIREFISFEPAFRYYLRKSLQSFLADEIYYVEIRSELPILQTLTPWNPRNEVDTANIYDGMSVEFQRKYENFVGLKIIYAPKVAQNISELRKQLAIVSDLKQRFPKLIAGFDQDIAFNLTTPLQEFGSELDKQNISFFFHSGATKMNSAIKDNIFDAIVLKSKRIGIAYSLQVHPVAEKVIKSNEIGLEICIVSNYIFQLVGDLRQNMPSNILSKNLPVVLGSDRPGIWDSYPLSEDFYIAWFAIMNRLGDIKPLKQLAYNSIIYSSMSLKEKKAAFKILRKRWREYINYINLDQVQANSSSRKDYFPEI